jgi:hypothetical protein
VVVDGTGTMSLQVFPGSLPNNATQIEAAVDALLK